MKESDVKLILIEQLTDALENLHDNYGSGFVDIIEIVENSRKFIRKNK